MVRRRNALRVAGHAVAGWAVVSWPVGWLWASLLLSPYTPPRNGVLPDGPPLLLWHLCLLPAYLSFALGAGVAVWALQERRVWPVLEGGLAFVSGVALHVALYFLVQMAF